MATHARLALLGLLAVGYLLLISSAGAGVTTERVSLASDGSEANEASYFARITSDGRYVVFTSRATNLAPGDDTNGYDDVFVYDRYEHTTELVSIDSSGVQGNGISGGWGATISIDDGRYVAFGSDATNLVPNDTNAQDDIFVYDREAPGTTERVSMAYDGSQANGSNWWGPAISGDGRYVAFASSATNLVPNDTNGTDDIFVRDRQDDTTERVNMAYDGSQSNGYSGFLGIAISADGRYVAFDSYATNLVPDDTNGVPDLFLRDRNMDTTERVSVDSEGNQANGWSDVEAISRDGQHVAFASVASNLVPNDTINTCTYYGPSCPDVFIHDRDTGATERVSVDSDGNQANGASFMPAISGDLRYVAFFSEATNLVPDDNNGYGDVFLRDRLKQTTKLISVSSDGDQGDWLSGGNGVAIGLDSRFVAYDSVATNLVPGDSNGFADIFVDPPEADPVGGLAELPDVAGDSGSSTGTYAALAGGLAAAALVLTAGAWYARRMRTR